MRLISKNYIIFSLCYFFLYWVKGYWLEWFDGSIFFQPNFMYFHLNPKIDNFGYWLMNDISNCLAGIIIANKIILRSYTHKLWRMIFMIFQSVFIAEIIDVIAVQFFLSGESFNSLFTLILGLIIFIAKIIRTYVRQDNR